MKTQKIQNLLVVTLFCAAALAGLTACDADPVEREGGKLPDKDGLENTYGMLRSNRASENRFWTVSIRRMKRSMNCCLKRIVNFRTVKP